jgi:hypothetical protein
VLGGDLVTAWAPTAPAAILALLSAFGHETGLAGVEIHDGPAVTESAALEAIIVGWYGLAGDALAVESQITSAGLAAHPGREAYAVLCAAMVRDGSGDMAAARARAYALVSACGSAIGADQKLGGVVMIARLGRVALQQVQDSGGALAIIEFTVECDAFTGR